MFCEKFLFSLAAVGGAGDGVVANGTCLRYLSSGNRVAAAGVL
jgi:hypothetical protein